MEWNLQAGAAAQCLNGSDSGKSGEEIAELIGLGWASSRYKGAGHPEPAVSTRRGFRQHFLPITTKHITEHHQHGLEVDSGFGLLIFHFYINLVNISDISNVWNIYVFI